MSKVVRSSSESEVQTWETEDDDMTEGDLGYGLGRRPGGICAVEVSNLFTSRKRSDGKNLSPPPSPRKGEESSGAIFQYSKQKSLQDAYPQGPRISSYRRQCSTDSNSELSNVELRQHLHETLEEVEVLKTELEACQRQLEGKEEALKILQSMAQLVCTCLEQQRKKESGVGGRNVWVIAYMNNCLLCQETRRIEQCLATIIEHFELVFYKRMRNRISNSHGLQTFWSHGDWMNS